MINYSSGSGREGCGPSIRQAYPHSARSNPWSHKRPFPEIVVAMVATFATLSEVTKMYAFPSVPGPNLVKRNPLYRGFVDQGIAFNCCRQLFRQRAQMFKGAQLLNDVAYSGLNLDG